MMRLSADDVAILEAWWVQKSRVNFLAYRKFIRPSKTKFKTGPFISDLAKNLQQFYVDYKAGKRPIYLIQAPPQHGKSWSVTDFISWIIGLDPTLRVVYGSYSEKLGIRCNLALQRVVPTPKYKKIFPETNLANHKTLAKRTTDHLEFLNDKMEITNGQFRNTTINGAITGESLDIGVIDDAVKGRAEANSLPVSDRNWDWLIDDFISRFSDMAGMIVIMTRWTNHDIAARLEKKYKGQDNFKVINYQAIAEKDESFRKEGEALFPALKSLEFLHNQKKIRIEQSWLSLYQGKPVSNDGNLISYQWWKWWETALPKMEFTFAVGDTAQKKNNWNDWTVFENWGYGTDGNIYLLDMFRDRVQAPDLRHEAEMFYNVCNTRPLGPFRGFCIEDKSSGTGLIQELEALNKKVIAVPRNTDKITRAYDTAPEIKAGKVFLNAGVKHVGYITSEAKEFPNGEYDDAFDCTMTAIEVAYLYPDLLNTKIFIA